MIRIFGTENCPFCVQAKQLAEKYNLEYTFTLISPDDKQMVEEFRLLFPEAKTVPQIIWNGRYIGGYTEFAQEIENTIGGYGDGQV